MRAALSWSVIALVLWPSLSARAERATLQTVDGERRAEIRSIEQLDTAPVLRTDGGALPLEDVGRVRFERRRASAIGTQRVFLRNGDEIAASVRSGDEENVVLEHRVLGTLRLPLDRLAALAYTDDRRQLARFRREALANEPERDEVILRSWVRRHGVLDAIDARGIAGEWDGLGQARFSADKALGLRLAPLGPVSAPIEPRTARVELLDGSVVTGRLLSLSDTALRLRLWATDADVELPLGAVATIWFPGSRFRYVSDLTPIDVEQRAQLISVVFPWRRDAAVGGGPLVLGGRHYRKGLGVHAFTRLAYELAGRYTRFRATIGLDDTARQTPTVVGTVVFQVLADGRPLLGEHGLLLSTDMPPRPITLDVRGVKRLELIADFGPSGDSLARGAWADASLVRARR